ncbi:YciI family protein [Streptomyces sp. NPDC007264]|uniref:YciI family protein n=1 Tax=Streptomyces sp. NPDC007264 TaxID=3364777 RepID=UPI0036DD236E
MFILELTYIAPAERVDEALADHVAWLDRQYEAGVFLASGRKVPRDGGVIVAVGESRAAVETLMATDPCVVEGVAEYRIIEFLATKTAPPLTPYRQQLPSS